MLEHAVLQGRQVGGVVREAVAEAVLGDQLEAMPVKEDSDPRVDGLPVLPVPY